MPMASALSAILRKRLSRVPTNSRRRCLSMVHICSIIEFLSKPLLSVTIVCVGSFAFVCSKPVMAAMITVGLCLLPVSLEMISTGRLHCHSQWYIHHCPQSNTVLLFEKWLWSENPVCIAASIGKTPCSNNAFAFPTQISWRYRYGVTPFDLVNARSKVDLLRPLHLQSSSNVMCSEKWEAIAFLLFQIL